MSLTHTYRCLRSAIALTAMMLCMHTAAAQSAQYKYDVGVELGMSGYIGDTSGNPFAHPGFDGELSFRYIGDTRWSIRGVLSTFGLSGDSSGMDDVLPQITNPATGLVAPAFYKFTSQVVDLSVRGEFNFFAYGIGETYKKLRRWTPYITVGVGVAAAFAKGNSAFAPTIPMGLGFKYKLSPRVDLGIEWTFTKAFNDHFDGKTIADLNQIKTAFYKNTDWYQRITLGISYSFGERCETCHYVD